MISNRITNHLLENKILDPKHLGFQPFHDNHTTITMLHQAKIPDLDTRIIIPLFDDFIHTFTDIWEIIATDASKSPSLTTVAGCLSAWQFGYRFLHINSIFTEYVLAM